MSSRGKRAASKTRTPTKLHPDNEPDKNKPIKQGSQNGKDKESVLTAQDKEFLIMTVNAEPMGEAEFRSLLIAHAKGLLNNAASNRGGRMKKKRGTFSSSHEETQGSDDDQQERKSSPLDDIKSGSLGKFTNKRKLEPKHHDALHILVKSRPPGTAGRHDISATLSSGAITNLPVFRAIEDFAFLLTWSAQPDKLQTLTHFMRAKPDGLIYNSIPSIYVNNLKDSMKERILQAVPTEEAIRNEYPSVQARFVVLYVSLFHYFWTKEEARFLVDQVLSRAFEKAGNDFGIVKAWLTDIESNRWQDSKGVPYRFDRALNDLAKTIFDGYPMQFAFLLATALGDPKLNQYKDAEIREALCYTLRNFVRDHRPDLKAINTDVVNTYHRQYSLLFALPYTATVTTQPIANDTGLMAKLLQNMKAARAHTVWEDEDALSMTWVSNYLSTDRSLESEALAVVRGRLEPIQSTKHKDSSHSDGKEDEGGRELVYGAFQCKFCTNHSHLKYECRKLKDKDKLKRLKWTLMQSLKFLRINESKLREEVRRLPPPKPFTRRSGPRQTTQTQQRGTSVNNRQVDVTLTDRTPGQRRQEEKSLLGITHSSTTSQSGEKIDVREIFIEDDEGNLIKVAPLPLRPGRILLQGEEAEECQNWIQER